MTDDDQLFNLDADALATFVQEYVRREDEPDAGTRAVIAAQLRDPRYLPHHVAEMLLSRTEIQAAIKVLRGVYKPRDTKDVSRDTISADMEVLYQEAKQARQFTAAIAAKKLQSEIHGLLVKDVNIHVRHTIETMPDSELESIAKRAVIDGEYTEVGGLPAVIDEQSSA